MDIGVTLRNMGSQSSKDTLLEGARAAEEAGLESLWITDHIAIPPDDAQGSDGRYLDPLVTLGVLAGATGRIRLGSGVLILPYRPALPTAKQIATLQELSGGRLLLGVGSGWMDAEFRALGIDRHQRGADSDRVLAFLRRCFDSAADGDRVSAHDQPFLFRPNPPAPPIYVGGRAPHALERAVRYGDGWLPMGGEPDVLAADLQKYAEIAEANGTTPGSTTLMRGLPLEAPSRCRELLDEYTELGVQRLVCGLRYDSIGEYRASIDMLANLL
jgi:probable F420-dependent oxidoreductase